MAKKGLTPKQNRALLVLAAGQTQEAAAQAAGVRRQRVQVWMKEHEFREELRLSMERLRHQFESRIVGLANNAAVVVQEAMEHPDLATRMEAAKTAINAAVRMATRYKELQVEGYVPPPTPMIMLPPGSKMPWENAAVSVTTPLPETIDVEATEIPEEPTDEPGTKPGTGS